MPELIDEANAIINDFISNLLGLIEGQFIDSIIANAEDQETKSYIRLLPLFEDVREVIDYNLEAQREIDNKFVVSLHFDYISQEFRKKENIIKFYLNITESDSNGYDIISSV